MTQKGRAGARNRRNHRQAYFSVRSFLLAVLPPVRGRTETTQFALGRLQVITSTVQLIYRACRVNASSISPYGTHGAASERIAACRETNRKAASAFFPSGNRSGLSRNGFHRKVGRMQQAGKRARAPEHQSTRAPEHQSAGKRQTANGKRQTANGKRHKRPTHTEEECNLKGRETVRAKGLAYPVRQASPYFLRERQGKTA